MLELLNFWKDRCFPNQGNDNRLRPRPERSLEHLRELFADSYTTLDEAHAELEWAAMDLESPAPSEDCEMRVGMALEAVEIAFRKVKELTKTVESVLQDIET